MDMQNQSNKNSNISILIEYNAIHKESLIGSGSTLLQGNEQYVENVGEENYVLKLDYKEISIN